MILISLINLKDLKIVWSVPALDELFYKTNKGSAFIE